MMTGEGALKRNGGSKITQIQKTGFIQYKNNYKIKKEFRQQNKVLTRGALKSVWSAASKEILLLAMF